nr:PREDICTED: uncharacterized protein LOC103315086 isoform X2 [Tribolium castaneum]XP_015840922.1 PREDICTED: uncharacterized protein LOC103315086 isoform X2 [Tribolium castaneum]|eukprot:XP_015840921.1 PREDICTED: uncharacterized protein LOC103315086 isoform X2 [Tribolium castaneum]
MSFLKFVMLVSLIFPIQSQETKIIQKNIFLARRKRYLTFPERSNFVISMALGKPFMMRQPKGFVLCLECDVPFPLPSDTRLHKSFKRNHHIQRRELLASFESIFDKYDLNGNACVKRMMCEAQQFIDSETRSFVRDVFEAIFRNTEPCNETRFPNCTISLMKYILGSFEFE